MAAAKFGAKFKQIKPSQENHAFISYHKTVQQTVKEKIVNRLKTFKFKIKEVCCDSNNTGKISESLKQYFSECLEKSDAWVEVLTDEYENCKDCESCYDEFTKKRQTTKLLQKRIQIPQDEMNKEMVLCVHSDYSADVDAFSGLPSDWFDDLQLAIVTRFHAFLSYHQDDKKMAEKIMEELKQNGYFYTHKGKFLSLNDVEKEAVYKGMSEKIIVLFSDLYMKDCGDREELVLPVVKDRERMAWIPVVIEWSDEIAQFLKYDPRIILIAEDILGEKDTNEIWRNEMETLQKAIADGLPSDCGQPRRDGPPDILPFHSIKSVVHSVGKIRVKYEKGPDTVGTAFCVGNKETPARRYVFTAYHVIGKTIDVMLTVLMNNYCTDQGKEQNLEKIGFCKETFEYHNGEQYNFKQKRAGEVKFGDYTECSEELKKRWNVSIDFLNEKGGVDTFGFEIDIPFMSQEHDVILLMLKPSTASPTFPEPLQLQIESSTDPTSSINKFWHLVGCKSSEAITSVAVATWCPVFVGHSFDHSKYWWQRRKPDGRHGEIHDEFLKLHRPNWVPFKCANKNFENGCSGSPCWFKDEGSSSQVYVQGLYLGCLPNVYFTKTTEKPASLALHHRPEKALSMTKIKEILHNSKLDDLITDLGL